MTLAAIPIDETERLADLRATHLMDTPAEERFDRLVKLSAHVLHAPIAFIALIDGDRQWFKAKCGFQMDSTGRDVSFCSHTILQSDPLIVPDTTQDERFSDNPLVVGEPHVRFYAGHPLRGPRGFNVGTICIIDMIERTFTEDQVKTLCELAQLCEHEIGLIGVIEAQRRILNTQKDLLHTQQRLANELAEAVSFVESLLPPPITEGPIRTDWLFLASEQLGGDAFGYHWLNDRQLAMYIVDVTGHGVGAALLSVSVHNALRRHTLPHTDFEQPDQVLAALNRAFPMDDNGGKFSTVWYGVFDLATRLLRYGAAGHPPALLLNNKPTHTALLGQPNFMIGVMDNPPFETAAITVPPDSTLYLYSDGASEAARREDGELLGTNGLATILTLHHPAPAPRLKRILNGIQQYQGRSTFDDDVTLVEVEMP